MMKIEPRFHFKEELQIGFGFEISKWSTNYEIPLQPLLPGRSSSCRSPIWQQRFYLTKSNTCDVNLLKHFPEVLFLLRASQLLLNAIKTVPIQGDDSSMNQSTKNNNPFQNVSRRNNQFGMPTNPRPYPSRRHGRSVQPRQIARNTNL